MTRSVLAPPALRTPRRPRVGDGRTATFVAEPRGERPQLRTRPETARLDDPLTDRKRRTPTPRPAADTAPGSAAVPGVPPTCLRAPFATTLVVSAKSLVPSRRNRSFSSASISGIGWEAGGPHPQQTLLEVVPVACAPGAVVTAKAGSVRVVAIAVLVELRRVLDLIPCAIHEHGLRAEVDIAHHTGREHHLLAEDPRTGIDDDVASSHLIRSFIDLTDRSVQCLDAEAAEVALRPDGLTVDPHIRSGHTCLLPWLTCRSTVRRLRESQTSGSRNAPLAIARARRSPR